jgi:hypothetical protein
MFLHDLSFLRMPRFVRQYFFKKTSTRLERPLVGMIATVSRPETLKSAGRILLAGGREPSSGKSRGQRT